jgi:amino acid adenylation domain-containing protein
MSPRPLHAGSTLVDLCRGLAPGSGPSFVWLHDGEESGSVLDFGTLDLRARALGQRLSQRHAPGTRALLLHGPGLEAIVGFFGCLYAGVVAVPAYAPRSARDDVRLRTILGDCGPAVALTSSADAGRVARFLEGSGVPLLATDEGGPELGGAWSLRAGGDDLAYLQYTSGSTSEPRGVMVSHGNVLANLDSIAREGAFDEASVSASWLPFFHDMGLVFGVLVPLHRAISAVMFAPAVFAQRPLRWLEAISRHRVTHSGGPDFAYDLCVRRVRPEERAGLDLSRWRIAFSGAEPIRQATLESFAACFASCGFDPAAFHPVYGLAEATLKVTGARAGAGAHVLRVDRTALAANRAVPSAEPGARTVVGCGYVCGPDAVAVVDPPTGTRLPDRSVGEIWVRGPSVAQGYWGRPEASDATFGARMSPGGDGPYLRTGDLGFLHEGELFVTGRLKDCIIVNGEKYYPQDLEGSIRAAHAGILAAAVFSLDQGDGPRLAAVIETDGERADEAIRAAALRAVAAEHGLRLDEALLVARGGIPRTSSGKIQRGECRRRVASGTLVARAARSTTAPTAQTPGGPSALEAWLSARCAILLGREAPDIDVEAPLALLGLDSLMATELGYAVQTELRLRTREGLFTPSLSIRILAGELASGEAMTASPAPPGASPGRHPLSASQRALWTLHELVPRNPTLNLVRCLRVLSGFDEPALRAALERAIQRHPALRTTFHHAENGPVQVVHEAAPLDFTLMDCGDETDESLLRRLHALAEEPFDLERGPLLRVRALRSSQGRVHLLLSLHHLVCDFWSLGVLCGELGTPDPLPLPVGPGMAGKGTVESALLASERGRRHWDFWRGALAGCDAPLTWRGGRRPEFRGLRRAGSCRFQIRAEAAGRLREFGRTRGASLFTTLLSVLQTLLGRHCAQPRFLVGIATHGRRDVAMQREVGYLVAPIGIPTDLSGNPTFEELHARTARSVEDALSHSSLSLAAAVERLRAEGEPVPRLQVMLSYLRAPSPSEGALGSFAVGLAGRAFRLGSMHVEPVAAPSRYTQFDLTVHASETDEGIEGVLEYDAGALSTDEAQDLARRLEELAGTLTRGGCRLLDVPAVAERDRRQQLEGWNATARAYDVTRPLHDLVTEAARRWADRPAVEGDELRLTHGEVETLAHRLAGRLRGRGAGPEAVVAVCAERCPEVVVAALGILKAGAVYLPLDPQFPRERLAAMIARAGCRTVLCQAEWTSFFDGRALDVIPLHGALDAAPEDSPWEAVPVAPGQGAYLIFTSGSTGSPKGALNTHVGICNRLLWMQERYGLQPDDTVLLKTPLTFDVSIWELFWPLLAGARLAVAPPGAHRDPVRVAELMMRYQVTTVHFVPSMLRAFLETPQVARCTSLRRVIASGEALAADLRDRFFRVLPAVELHNLYGPTEAAVDVTAWQCAPLPAGLSVPIGRPIANVRTYVVDPALHLRPAGQPGELCLAGPCLARGYAGEPGLTAERFVPDPFAAAGERMYRTGDLARHQPDGTLEFLGRLDDQVKVGGVRIEPGEVEAVCRRHPAVRDCAVVARAAAAGDKVLAAHFVPKGPLSAAELRAWLAQRLPGPMVPAIVVLMPELPLNASGKVDRATLARFVVAPGAGPRTPPRTPLELEIAALWQNVLPAAPASVHATFLEAGGSSLLAVQLAARIREHFQLELPVASLLAGTDTIASQAAAVERLLIEGAAPHEVESALRALPGA